MQTDFKTTAGLFAYLFARLMTSGYPSVAKIRKNRPRCSPRGGFLCSFNTITPKLPHSKPFPIHFASVLGVRQYTYLSGANSETYRIKASEGCVQVAFQGNGWDGMAWLFFRNGDVDTGEPILIKGKDFDSRGSITYHDEGTAETRAYDVSFNAWSKIIVTGFGVSNLTITEL